MAQVIHDAKGDHIEIEATEARQGAKGVPVFWVLLISSLLAAVVLLTVWGFRSSDLARADATQTPPLVAQPESPTPLPARTASSDR